MYPIYPLLYSISIHILQQYFKTIKFAKVESTRTIKFQGALELTEDIPILLEAAASLAAWHHIVGTQYSLQNS